MKVLFVCLGNICRSPTADGILRAKAPGWEVDSAGTAAYHLGKPPDARATAEAARHGIDLTALRARQARATDFHHYDHILAMDRQNLANLRVIRPDTATAELSLLLDLLPDQPLREVPDPYYEDGFDSVFTLIDRACVALIDRHRREQ